MTFEEILAHVLAVLQREKRVSYRALKRRFALDDDYLEDVKDELIYAKKLAIDEENRVLVWTGTIEVAADTASPPDKTSQQPQIKPPRPGPHTPEAERRQLTVMFCDLVESTKLASQLDLEDLRNIVREYQTVCSEVITRFDGHIAQLLGDGLLVYFGYPLAHEDDAQRAVWTGLGILDAMGDLHSRLKREKGIQLAVRLGIHTGLVVVGAMGSGGRQEQLALGETPNIAARIQGLAEPNTLVISDATSRLVQGYFACQPLGKQTLRGVTEPLNVYRALSESGAQNRFDIVSARGLTPLVGREQEVGLLFERWEQVKAGQGQVVLLSGEGGIGKSRLVQALKEHVANEPHMRWECRSSEYYQNTALFPVANLFQRLWQWRAEDTPNEKLAKLEHALSPYRLPLEESVPLFAPVLSLPLPENHYPLLNVSPQRQRQKTLETIVAILLELAERQPVLFIVEDLHWTDPTTLELLNLVIEQIPTTSMLMLPTCRPTFQPSWSHRSYLTEITVNRLSHTQVAQIVTRITDGKTFPPEILQQIIAKTDGVPLFVEEITKAILESGHLKAIDNHYELTGSLLTLAIPATLQDSLMARLDRLVSAKTVAQLAAVIGRQFAYDLLHTVSQLDEATLQHELSRLVDAELVYQRGLLPHATYIFKHALIRDAAYESLLKSTRQKYHQQIAQVLEAQFPETAETQPELLARHYTEAGLNEQAVHYWYKARQNAIERSAHVEAIAHLRQGLALLQTLPETPQRLPREVNMYIALGASLIATKGQAASEVGETYTSARQLCQHLEDPDQLFPALRGLFVYYNVRAEYQTAHALGEQLLALAQQTQDAAMLVAAHRALGVALFWMGAVALAHAHFMQGIALYDPQQHRTSAFLYGDDAGVVCHSFASWPCEGSSWTWEVEFDPFIRGLRELGYKPGETVMFECRSAGGRDSGFATAATELVQLPADIIVGSSQPAGRAAHNASKTIPIVTIVSGDPVAGGLAQSLARPGGNLTGVSYYATELTAKRLELLKEMIPGIGTVGVLANPTVSYLPFEQDTKQAASRLGLALRIHQVSEAADLKIAFSRMEADRVQAVFVLPDMMFAWESDRIADLALEHRLPTMAWGGWFTESGCLMAYSSDYVEMNHRLAYYVDRILKGAKPGDLPIEQPTTFKLSINMKTAKVLGIEVSSTLLLQADQIIE